MNLARHKFDSAYWQDIDEKRAYPEAFVFVKALVPEGHSGSGLSLTKASVIMEGDALVAWGQRG